jgi:hypothetical protein
MTFDRAARRANPGFGRDQRRAATIDRHRRMGRSLELSTMALLIEWGAEVNSTRRQFPLDEFSERDPQPSGASGDGHPLIGRIDPSGKLNPIAVIGWSPRSDAVPISMSALLIVVATTRPFIIGTSV